MRSASWGLPEPVFYSVVDEKVHKKPPLNAIYASIKSRIEDTRKTQKEGTVNATAQNDYVQ